MQDHRAEIEASGHRLVVVGADPPKAIESIRQRFGLTFPIHSDPKLEVAKAYGVRQKGLDLALPSTFVVGSDGRVRFVHVAPNPVDRLSTAALLAALRSD